MIISKEKKDKIAEQILAFLYQKNPLAQFTSYIAKEVARDEEFVKEILEGLKEKGLIVEIKKNPLGVAYSRRSRWKLSSGTYDFYRKIQN